MTVLPAASRTNSKSRDRRIRVSPACQKGPTQQFCRVRSEADIERFSVCTESVAYPLPTLDAAIKLQRLCVSQKTAAGARVDLIIARVYGSIADGSFDIETLFHDQLFVAAGTNSPWVRRRRLRTR